MGNFEWRANRRDRGFNGAGLTAGSIGRAQLTFMAALLGHLGCHGGSSHPGGAPGTGGATSTGGNPSDNPASSGGTGVSGDNGTGGGPSTGGSSESDGVEVRVDPYGHCPLTAVVNIPGVDPSEVEALQVVVAGKDGAPDFTRRYDPSDPAFVAQLDSSDLLFSSSGSHVPVLGLYADAESSVRISIERPGAQPIDLSLDIETHLTRPEESPWAPGIQIKTAMTELMEPGWTLAEISKEPNPAPPVVIVDWTRTIAFDERGALRWALRPELPPGETFTTTRSLGGNFLTGSLDTIIEITKLGRVVHSFEVSGYSLHHEILQIGSDDAAHASPGTSSEHLGRLLVLASKDGASTIQDHVLELDQEAGTILNDWDLATVLDPKRTAYIDPEQWAPGAGDWLHANGLAYSKDDESVIVSGRHQGVAKIRRDGTLFWILAPHEGWQAPQSDKLLTAVDSSLAPYDESVQLGNEAAGDPVEPDFGWAFGQHSPALLPNGDLLLFDNGSSRHFGPTCGSVSRAVIYHIDEEAMTVRQMGQFRLSKAESSCFVSNTHFLPMTGNLFIQPGSAYFDSGSSVAVVKEVGASIANDGTIVFDSVVFDATVDMSLLQAGSFAYSYRGHRWVF